MHSLLRSATILIISFAATAPSYAAEQTYKITFQNGSFEPKELTLPANQKVKLEIENKEAKAIEFESHDMKAEKIIKEGKSRSIFVGPLKAGEYSFFDEFNEAAGKGKVIVK